MTRDEMILVTNLITFAKNNRHDLLGPPGEEFHDEECEMCNRLNLYKFDSNYILRVLYTGNEVAG